MSDEDLDPARMSKAGLDPALGFPFPDEEINRTKAAGNAKQQAHQFVVDIDIAMRHHYAINLKALSKTLYPIMYAEATFAGGRYTFCVDEHTTYACQESSPVYTQLKAIAHIPLAIYAIIFPYTDYPANGQWLEPLRVYLHQVIRVQKNLEILEISEPAQGASRRILNQAKAFMEKLIADENFTIDAYESFCREIAADLLINQNHAAADQAQVMSGYLRKWKDLVGEATWDKMYVVCQCIWTASKESVHEEIIKKAMKPEKHDTNIIISEAVPTLDSAKLLLARILADRALAAKVFPRDGDPEYLQNQYSTSTERDLLSRSIQSELSKPPAGCPIRHG
ncbi:hypothetical protein D3C77_400520 [compost metagenome]